MINKISFTLFCMAFIGSLQLQAYQSNSSSSSSSSSSSVSEANKTASAQSATDSANPNYGPVNNAKSANSRAEFSASSAKQSKALGIKDPVIFAQTGYRYSSDSSAFGYDNNENITDIGVDMDIMDGWIVGLMYTFNYRGGTSLLPSPALAPNVNQKAEDDYYANSISLYSSKKFGDWFLAGTSLTYMWIDQTLTFSSALSGLPPVTSTTSLDRTAFGVSPFVGVSHGWGNWNFAATVAYNYSMEYYESMPITPSFNLHNQNIMSTIRASYTVDERWTLGGKVSNTWLVQDDQLPNSVFTPAPGAVPTTNLNNNYTTVGVQVNFRPYERWDTYLGLDSDLGIANYWDVYAKIGATYSF